MLHLVVAWRKDWHSSKNRSRTTRREASTLWDPSSFGPLWVSWQGYLEEDRKGAWVAQLS